MAVLKINSALLQSQPVKPAVFTSTVPSGMQSVRRKAKLSLPLERKNCCACSNKVCSLHKGFRNGEKILQLGACTPKERSREQVSRSQPCTNLPAQEAVSSTSKGSTTKTSIKHAGRLGLSPSPWATERNTESLYKKRTRTEFLELRCSW